MIGATKTEMSNIYNHLSWAARVYLVDAMPCMNPTAAEARTAAKRDFSSRGETLSACSWAPTTNINEIVKPFTECSSAWYPSVLGDRIFGLIHYNDILAESGMEILHVAQPFPDAATIGAVRHRDVIVRVFKSIQEALSWKSSNPGKGVGMGCFVWPLMDDGRMV